MPKLRPDPPPLRLLDVQEKGEERLRALRLRLYVSETRRKALEEALLMHVEAAGLALAPSAARMDDGEEEARDGGAGGERGEARSTAGWR